MPGRRRSARLRASPGSRRSRSMPSGPISSSRAAGGRLRTDMPKLASVATLMFAVAVAVAGPAHAGGLIVPGYGSQGQPRAGAFVAKADDPSALYYNPAGFARQRGTSVQIGLNFIDFSQRFRRAGAYEPTEDGA